jgi:uncharacterized protein YjiS (DUF1127 family)
MRLPEDSGGDSGWFRRGLAAKSGAKTAHCMETDMSTNIPVVPLAGGTLLRAFFSLLALVTRWAKEIARARRHRRQAAALAGLDRRMLADIGINRADLNDAFSQPFWQDPTALLRERACERRVNRSALRGPRTGVEPGFRRLSTDRPARQTI